MRPITPRRAWLALAVGLIVGGLARPSQAQYPYGYGYGYGPGYNVPVTPGFGATYGGSIFGSYGYGQNRTYTTFGPVIGTATKATAAEAAISGRTASTTRSGYRVQGGTVLVPPTRFGLSADRFNKAAPRTTAAGSR